MKKIKVLVADDHPVFREGLCRFLENEPDIEVVAQAVDGGEAVRMAKELLPDVAIIDVAMPNLGGIEAARQIKVACPTTAILVVSAFDYEAYMLASLQAGAAGYMLKSAPVNDLVSAVRMVCSGEAVFNMGVTSKVMGRLATAPGRRRGISELHDRELQVLKLAAKGISNKEVAAKLGISDRTVQSHMVNIFRKLNVSSRTEAVLHALREGWLIINDLPEGGIRDG